MRALRALTNVHYYYHCGLCNSVGKDHHWSVYKQHLTTITQYCGLCNSVRQHLTTISQCLTTISQYCELCNSVRHHLTTISQYCGLCNSVRKIIISRYIDNT